MDHDERPTISIQCPRASAWRGSRTTSRGYFAGVPPLLRGRDPRAVECLDNTCLGISNGWMKPVSDLEDHLGYWLRKLSNHVSDSFAARLEKHGVSVANWVVLRILFNHDALPLKEIVAQVGVDQGALSRMVERLMVRGLVVRKESPKSRREVAISLTKEGRNLVPKLAQEADDNDRVFFRQLSAQERAELLAMVQTLISQSPNDATNHPIK